MASGKDCTVFCIIMYLELCRHPESCMLRHCEGSRAVYVPWHLASFSTYSSNIITNSLYDKWRLMFVPAYRGPPPFMASMLDRPAFRHLVTFLAYTNSLITLICGGM